MPLGQRSSTEFTLARNITSKAEVAAVMEQAKKGAGASHRSGPQCSLGGFIGSFQDPDGHLWEVAWHPDWKQEKLITRLDRSMPQRDPTCDGDDPAMVT